MERIRKEVRENTQGRYMGRVNTAEVDPDTATGMADRNSNFTMIDNEVIGLIPIIGMGPFALYCAIKSMTNKNKPNC